MDILTLIRISFTTQLLGSYIMPILTIARTSSIALKVISQGVYDKVIRCYLSTARRTDSLRCKKKKIIFFFILPKLILQELDLSSWSYGM